MVKSFGIVFETASPFDTQFRMAELVQWAREAIEKKHYILPNPRLPPITNAIFPLFIIVTFFVDKGVLIDKK